MNNQNDTVKPFLVSEEEKKSILKEHTLVYIKHPMVYEGMLNCIERYDGENIFIRATEPFLNNSIFIDDGVICQVLTENHEYLSFGRIADIGICKSGQVRVNIHEVHRFINIRKDKRYLVNLCCNAVDIEADSTFYAIIKNISRNGINIVCKENLNKGDLVDIEFPFEECDRGLVTFRAKILRTESNTGYREYGLEIREIDHINGSNLKSLLEKLDKDEKYAFQLYKSNI